MDSTVKIIGVANRIGFPGAFLRKCFNIARNDLAIAFATCPRITLLIERALIFVGEINFIHGNDQFSELVSALYILYNAALSREPERVCGEVAAVDVLSRAGARSIENRAQRDFRACEQGLACGSRKAASLRAVAFREPRQTAPEAPR